MNKEIDDYDYYERKKEAKKIFKIAVDYLKLKSAEIEKSRELFAEYLKWNNSEWDVDTIVYEKIGDAYTKYSKNNDRFKSEAEINYKKAFNYLFENKDKTDLLAETYRYSLSEYYLKGIGTPVSREKSYEMFESWYDYISKNAKLRMGLEADKLYRYLESFYGRDGHFLSTSINMGEDIDLKGLKVWLTRILEFVPTHRDAKRDIEVVDRYLENSKLLKSAKRRKEERDANEIIFNKIKNCVTKKPPDFDQAYKIYVENNSDEFSDEVSHLEYLGKIYLEIAQKKNSILIAEAEKLHKSAFELCQKELNDSGSSLRLARFHFEGIGTKKSFTRGQGTLIISFRNMPESNDEEKSIKSVRAYEISNTFQKKNLYGFAVEGAKEDLKVAMTWMLKAKSLGAGNRLSKFDEKFEELEQKISSQNLEHASSNEKITKTFDNEVGIENKNIKSNEIQKIKKIVTELEPLQITMKNFESIKKWYPGLGFYEYAFSENELDFIKNITKVILDSKRSGLFRTKQPIPLLEYVEQFYKIVREERSEIGLNFLNKLERPFLDYLYPDIFIQLGFQTNGKRDIFGTISY